MSAITFQSESYLADLILPFVEVFDVRAHRWRPATVDLDEPEDIVRAQHALLWTTL